MSDEQDAQTIFRNASFSGDFTVISTPCLKDYTLSLEAHCVLLRLLALPKNWTFHKGWALKSFAVGRDRLDKLLVELVGLKYAKVERERRTDGTLGPNVYSFTDAPGQFKPLTEIQELVASEPRTDRQGLAARASIERNRYKKKEVSKSDFKKGPPASDPAIDREKVGSLVLNFAKQLKMPKGRSG